MLSHSQSRRTHSDLKALLLLLKVLAFLTHQAKVDRQHLSDPLLDYSGAGAWWRPYARPAPYSAVLSGEINFLRYIPSSEYIWKLISCGPGRQDLLFSLPHHCALISQTNMSYFLPISLPSTVVLDWSVLADRVIYYFCIVPLMESGSIVLVHGPW